MSEPESSDDLETDSDSTEMVVRARARAIGAGWFIALVVVIGACWTTWVICQTVLALHGVAMPERLR